jgi:hypothetical protein
MILNRRDFLMGLSTFTFYSLLSCTRRKPHDNEQQQGEFDMQLRPHHILDIVSDYGQDIIYQPHPYGHSLHIVAPKLLSSVDLKVKLVVAADDICKGCMHLKADGTCDDVLAQLHPSPSKQAYNDVLDCRLLDYLAIENNSVMTVRKFLQIVNEKVPGIEKICTHPKEDEKERLKGLVKGLTKLGVRVNTQKDS